MKRFLSLTLACSFAAVLPAAGGARSNVFAQSHAPAPAATPAANGDGKTAAAASTTAPARELYEEAASYTRRKFDEYATTGVPYSEQLRHMTFQKQRELALRNAAVIESRGPAAGLDLYHLGRLYELGGKSAEALDALRRFLAAPEGAAGEFAQAARAALVPLAVGLKQPDEARKVFDEYVRAAPRADDEIHRLNIVMASHYQKGGDYQRAAAHARDAYGAALRLASSMSAEPSQRDQLVFQAGAHVVNALLKGNKRAEAVAAVQEMRARALGYPSARLYGQATEVLLDLREPLGAAPVGAGDGAGAAAAPALKVTEWIDQQPATLASLRGKVVLLDFWATWCLPCRVTIPKLNALHRKYKDQGLVILGMTNYFGHAEGRQLVPAEELAYLRQFKRKNQIAYGFAVADHEENDQNYGIASIPTAVLIDRRGRVRFITTGASEVESKALAAIIRQLIEER